ncbi:hypothetical protein ACFLIM_37885 [Nonomuraea sp. M3C6]|uniref:Small secreted domain n=1 Tax=Nonomuraea marmarensis TaxID=3351344 RepID=A0ABW7ARW1_9ACTN
MRVKGPTIAGLAVIAGVLLPSAAAYADGEARKEGPTPLIGDVIIFNDEIVEPVSLPVSTCGSLLPLLGKSPSTCEGASRVSDDDA